MFNEKNESVKFLDRLYKRNDVICYLIISSRATCLECESTDYFKLSATCLVKEAFNEVTIDDALGLT